jgi:hypothetical protein
MSHEYPPHPAHVDAVNIMRRFLSLYINTFYTHQSAPEHAYITYSDRKHSFTITFPNPPFTHITPLPSRWGGNSKLKRNKRKHTKKRHTKKRHTKKRL